MLLVDVDVDVLVVDSDVDVLLDVLVLVLVLVLVVGSRQRQPTQASGVQAPTKLPAGESVAGSHVSPHVSSS